MKRGLRLILVGALCLHVSGLYALHPGGVGLSWQLLCARHEWPYLLLLLSQVAIVGGCLWFAGVELAAYRRWKRGRPGPQDAQREADWAVALHRFGTPGRLLRALAETGREAWYERRRTFARAQRRWPRKQRELHGWLAQAWSPNVWMGVALVVGGELLAGYLTYRLPGYSRSPVLSLGAALAGLSIGNALVFVGWVAGDDDDGGHRSFPLPPRTPTGHKLPLPARVSLRVQRAGKVRVPQARAGR